MLTGNINTVCSAGQAETCAPPPVGRGGDGGGQEWEEGAYRISSQWPPDQLGVTGFYF